ncbi:Tripartite ATP-independent periplasmic transporter DctQ component [Spirochaeta thermophila DSM 6578]|uniref:Tripartite ATP-independent periplasmic transporter DctQ component n=1 Tax=Winmispira thermophila (strain ATCC 700085 / DSM 6578 / Z-1203) TaxID=869211 RepID=G0GAD2_WINT7|nr:TRAP transporter small permease [Spirochaeta thermophila]AEJ61751.1 Tripartite ATP-independent periplasmic transporter DctQ component [Spirochaeta thermophila DSM 6578]
MKHVIKILNLLYIVTLFLAKILFALMVLIIFTNVVLRYVFNSGLRWSEEVSLVFLVWFAFISIALGVKQNLHIGLHLVNEESLPPLVNRVLHILDYAAKGVVGVIMMVYGRILIVFTLRSILPATHWPAGILYLILPIAGFFITAESLMALLGIPTDQEAVESVLEGRMTIREYLQGVFHA